MAFDGFEACAVFFGDDGAAIAGERLAFDFGGKIVGSDEVGNELRAESNDGWILFFAGAEHDAREGGAWIFIDGFAVRGFGALVGDEASFKEGILLGRGKDYVIHPFEEIGAGFIAHAVGELAGE